LFREIKKLREEKFRQQREAGKFFFFLLVLLFKLSSLRTLNEVEDLFKILPLRVLCFSLSAFSFLFCCIPFCNVLAEIKIKIKNRTIETINGGVMIFNKTPIETPRTSAGMSNAANEYSISGFE
jgi:hypothetical protein